MARKTDTKTDAIRLMSDEISFERSGISGLVCRPDAAPRREEMPEATHARLLRDIARDDVVYIVFSYRTPIAWVYRNGAVNLPEIKYSKTTSMHQNWVREAFGDRVNEGIPTEPVEGDAPVVLSENEEIILRRMRDEDGTEYRLYFGLGGIPQGNSEYTFKAAPSDQVEPLITKGLVDVCYTAQDALEVARGGNANKNAAHLTDKGRAHLDQIQPVVKTEVSPDQYKELGEDDLIDLLAQLAGQYKGATGTIVADMVALARALKDRRDATAPARRRIGEYLRQQAMYAATQKRELVDELDSVRADEYAQAASLRMSDLRSVVQSRVWDSKAAFFAEQDKRLEQWEATAEYRKLPAKQQALLSCVAKGHIFHNYRGWRGDEPCCRDVHGATMNSLTGKRHIVTIRSVPGFRHDSSVLMLKKPE